MSVNSSRLEEALTGQLEGISARDVAKLFAFSGESNNAGIRFLSGGLRTAEGEVEVDITAAAEQASVVGTRALAPTTEITSGNNTLSLLIDGAEGEVTLEAGTYTADELAAELERAINTSAVFRVRNVSVTLDGGALRLTTDSYGSSSQISQVSGTAASDLGFNGSEFDIGQDVVGKFIVDGKEELAIGSGRLLSGRGENERTADLQVNVTLTNSQLGDGAEATLTVTRGFASRLDAQLDTFFKDEEGFTGQVASVNNRYGEVLDSIQDSIDRLNARFDAQQESLIRQFTQLETIVAELQNTGGYLAALLPS